MAFSIRTVNGLPTITDLSVSIDGTFSGDATGTVTTATPGGDIVLGRVTAGGNSALTGHTFFPGVSSIGEVITLAGNGGTNGTVSLSSLTYQVSISPASVVKVASKCRGAIVKAADGFVRAKATALQKCREAILKGKLPPATVCHADAKTAAAIAKASTKLSAGIVKACAGKDKTCGTQDADGSEPALSDIGWNIGHCPNFEGGTCTNAIDSCSDISTCIECISEAAVDQAIGLYYDGLTPTDPQSKDPAVKALAKCQATIGKAATKFLVAKSKSLAKCWTAVSKVGSGTCPDATAATAIAAAESKKQAAIEKACQGPDKQLGTSDDETPTAIGFPNPCPTVTIPGGASCGHAVDTLGDLITCADCVTEFKVDCASLAAVPAFVTPYPAECNLKACSLTLQPTSSTSVQFRNVLWSGKGYTPNGTVDIMQPSGWLGICRGLVIVPGTTITADASGNFSLFLPPTALSFSIIVQPVTQKPIGTFVQVGAVDSTSGCSSPTIDYPLVAPGPSPNDSLTLLYATTTTSSVLAPPAMPVAGENGSGSVITGQCHTSGPTELRFTLTGAMPSRTLTMFVTPSGSSAVSVGTVTTDGAGNATFASYLPHCFGNLGASSTLSLTVDGNPPGAGNVAYQSTLVRNDIPVC
ncbi:MAG: hypothetical protein E6J72_03175 [Deltaproteobacteria bacterium]|nr:MAG: hypothetical protein E6J72_03175 [Deltaproteobacteria bacterium]